VSRPHRQTRRELRPCLHLSEIGALDCALQLRRKVADIRRQTGSGAFVLMDPCRRIYVLRVASVAACAELVEDWLVGHYHDTPDVLQLFDDLVERARECVEALNVRANGAG
jgi:hypothetical protein